MNQKVPHRPHFRVSIDATDAFVLLDAGRPMEDLKDPKVRKSRISRTYIPAGTYVLRPGTLIAAVIAVILAQMALAIPAVLNGLFQQDLGTSSSQLTWISDAFLVPVCMLELSFGVLGDLFGRKRLLVGGAIVLAIGEAVAVLTPGATFADQHQNAGALGRRGPGRTRRGRHLPDQPRHDRGGHAHHSRAEPVRSRSGRPRCRSATAPRRSWAGWPPDCASAQIRWRAGGGRSWWCSR